MARKGLALEPHSANAQACFAWAYLGSLRFEESIPEFRKAVSFDPDAAFPLWSLGMALQQAGQLDEAVATLERAVAVTQREHCHEIALLGGALAAVGRTQDARALLEELLERARREYVPPFDLALLHCALGETGTRARGAREGASTNATPCSGTGSTSPFWIRFAASPAGVRSPPSSVGPPRSSPVRRVPAARSATAAEPPRRAD